MYNNLSVFSFFSFLQILMNVHLFLAPMAERALMKLNISLVSACLASPETNARRVRVLFRYFFGRRRALAP